MATIITFETELQKQIQLARIALSTAKMLEETSDYEIDATMERKYLEGFTEALEFIYILQNGHEYEE